MRDRTFILEPILTPSALVDAEDNTDINSEVDVVDFADNLDEIEASVTTVNDESKIEVNEPELESESKAESDVLDSQAWVGDEEIGEDIPFINEIEDSEELEISENPENNEDLGNLDDLESLKSQESSETKLEFLSSEKDEDSDLQNLSETQGIVEASETSEASASSENSENSEISASLENPEDKSEKNSDSSDSEIEVEISNDEVLKTSNPESKLKPESVTIAGNSEKLNPEILDSKTLDVEKTEIIKTSDESEFEESESVTLNFNSGYFTVGESGEVSIDYLYDGGGYHGELGIFSLSGLDNSLNDAADFSQMALDRVSSSSSLGYLAISDVDEGAFFSGDLGEARNYNKGDYTGVKHFQFNPGDRIALMLVPNGRIAEILENLHLEGSKQPLFSLETANPEDAFHFGQIADIKGDDSLFVLEDQRVDAKSDRDYNDLIFRIDGVTANIRHLDSLINSAQDWRNLELGQQILESSEPLETSEILDISKSEVSEPKVSESTVSESTVSESEISEPEVSESPVSESPVSEVEISELDITESEVSESTVSESEISEPEISEPEVSESPVSESPVSEPEDSDSESKISEPTISQSEDSDSEISESEVSESEVSENAIEATTAAESPTPPLIGVIDTGFSPEQPNLNDSQILLGSDLIDGDDNPLDGNTATHGDRILEVIATHSQPPVEAGVESEPQIWVSRAVGGEADWARALIEFVDTAKETGQENAIANLSFDLTETQGDGTVVTRTELTTPERITLEYARQHGVIVVVAAGNTGQEMSALGQAALAFDNVLTVGATESGERAVYSSLGEGLNLLADGDFGEVRGTSIATAKVTAAASQVWAANPELNYVQVMDILRFTADDLGEPGWDAETGSGVLDVSEALELSSQVVPKVYRPIAWNILDDFLIASQIPTQYWDGFYRLYGYFDQKQKFTASKWNPEEAVDRRATTRGVWGFLDSFDSYSDDYYSDDYSFDSYSDDYYSDDYSFSGYSDDYDYGLRDSLYGDDFDWGLDTTSAIEDVMFGDFTNSYFGSNFDEFDENWHYDISYDPYDPWKDDWGFDENYGYFSNDFSSFNEEYYYDISDNFEDGLFYDFGYEDGWGVNDSNEFLYFDDSWFAYDYDHGVVYDHEEFEDSFYLEDFELNTFDFESDMGYDIGADLGYDFGSAIGKNLGQIDALLASSSLYYEKIEEIDEDWIFGLENAIYDTVGSASNDWEMLLTGDYDLDFEEEFNSNSSWDYLSENTGSIDDYEIPFDFLDPNVILDRSKYSFWNDQVDGYYLDFANSDSWQYATENDFWGTTSSWGNNEYWNYNPESIFWDEYLEFDSGLEAKFSSEFDSYSTLDLPSSQAGSYLSYTVQPGDTLWDISQAVYSDGTYWHDIQSENGGFFDEESAQYLQIGEKIYLPSEFGNINLEVSGNLTTSSQADPILSETAGSLMASSSGISEDFQPFLETDIGQVTTSLINSGLTTMASETIQVLPKIIPGYNPVPSDFSSTSKSSVHKPTFVVDSKGVTSNVGNIQETLAQTKVFDTNGQLIFSRVLPKQVVKAAGKSVAKQVATLPISEISAPAVGATFDEGVEWADNLAEQYLNFDLAEDNEMPFEHRISEKYIEYLNDDVKNPDYWTTNILPKVGVAAGVGLGLVGLSALGIVTGPAVLSVGAVGVLGGAAIDLSYNIHKNRKKSEQKSLEDIQESDSIEVTLYDSVSNVKHTLTTENEYKQEAMLSP